MSDEVPRQWGVLPFGMPTSSSSFHSSASTGIPANTAPIMTTTGEKSSSADQVQDAPPSFETPRNQSISFLSSSSPSQEEEVDGMLPDQIGSFETGDVLTNIKKLNRISIVRSTPAIDLDDASLGLGSSLSFLDRDCVQRNTS